jgi:hypothetical protein
MTAPGLWRLPGPSRHATLVRSALDRGFSPVLSLPNWPTVPGTRDNWTQSTGTRTSRTPTASRTGRPPPSSRTLWATTCSRARMRPASSRGTTRWRADSADRRRRLRRRAWCDFVRRFVSASRAAAVADLSRLLRYWRGAERAPASPRRPSPTTLDAGTSRGQLDLSTVQRVHDDLAVLAVALPALINVTPVMPRTGPRPAQNTHCRGGSTYAVSVPWWNSNRHEPCARTQVELRRARRPCTSLV